MKTKDELYAQLELTFNALLATLKAGNDPANKLKELCDYAHGIDAHAEREAYKDKTPIARGKLAALHDEVAGYAFSLYADAMALHKQWLAYLATGNKDALSKAHSITLRMETLYAGINSGRNNAVTGGNVKTSND